ncbi:MAG: multidrug efflux RND transporter permease subunit [Acidobacteriaceae bacterium]|nr:multidrug efflux RND transporter permease subunit [Acidobacteriaceae bacterium]
MSLSSPFIKRPVATTLLTAAVGLAGAVAFRLLPVSPLPQVDFPTLSVSASLPGASPEIMASSIATPLERQFGRIAAVTEMTSSSTLGQTSISLQFDLNRNIDAAARDVQAAINAARGYLPANLPNNPTYRKVNPSDFPIMIVALTSDRLPPSALYDAGSTVLMQRISQIRGVGQVIVGGSSAPAVRIDLNPTAIDSRGLSLENVRTAIAAETANEAKGSFSDRRKTWSINANDQLLHAIDYEPIVLAYRNGGPVRLNDVARVSDSVQTVRSLGLSNGKRSALIVIFRQPGANIIATVDGIKAALPQLKASINPSIDMTVVLDQTITIRASVHDVEITLLIAICLVVLVVFVFLRDVRSTLIPSVAVPVSLMGTCGVMYLLGFSVDNLSLMALTISTGFVVDDAIVVLENITRYREQGMSTMQSAFKGAAEIGPTVLSISLSLVAVFIPILMMGGIVGRLFREFAVTLSVTILISLLISLTTTPMMCSRLLSDEKQHGRLYRASEKIFVFILKVYEKSLGWVLEHSAIMLLLTVLTLALNVYLFIKVPKGFFPQQDNGRLNGNFIGDQDISFQSMSRKMLQLSNIVLTDPGVDSVQAFSGGGAGTTANTGRAFIALKPGRNKKETADVIINRLRPKLAVVPGVTLFLQASQDVRVGGRSSAAQYQYTLQSDNLNQLTTWAPRLVDSLKKLPQLTDVVSDQQNHGLEALLTIDRQTGARMGITPREMDNILYDAFGEREIARTYLSQNQYFVVMEVDPVFWQTPEGLKHVYVRSTSGGAVPLAAFTQYRPSTAALAVTHSGVFPSVTISFNLAPGVALGDAVTAITNAGARAGMPATINTNFSGTAQAFQESLANEPMLIAAALIAVYIVLGMLYESYIHPITILSTLPSAGVGAILALMLTHTDLTVIALIGMLLLIGIVKKNAIMMIDFALDVERREKKPPKEAVFQACLLRFRPIMMTTMAALFGGLPLALGTGMGSELRRPLGITIVGGLIVSQAVTLYTTPVIYLYMDRFSLWIRRLHRPHLPQAPVEAVRPAS